MLENCLTVTNSGRFSLVYQIFYFDIVRESCFNKAENLCNVGKLLDSHEFKAIFFGVPNILF
ncbi:hypothetical protein WN55_04298 [Dufourea novaeangliae]|uniref:Uncharacterized protein n=1 Tax=Dufourea novaeangliae TaxID=178035 RepID=A0A154PLN9_DUFNO|nr:hypothetical protein WN55_04298 [Dufourea novaeangliae]